MKLTYCNPLSIANIPDGRPLDASLSKDWSATDYRSISDPSVIYHDGKWILYPSYQVAYVTEDFVHWKHVDVGVHDVRYSPAIVQFRGKWYMLGHGMADLYCSDSPTGPFTVCGQMTGVDGKIKKTADACFLADGDHLYIYYPENVKIDGMMCCLVTMGAELDPDEPWKFLTQPVELYRSDGSASWQRWGEHNQEGRALYLEGQWAIKKNGRYYLLFSSGGTEFSSYAHGVMISEEGPLSGFRPQKRHDPLTRKDFGLVRGAGHGSIVEGPNDTLWIFYTCRHNFNHLFERRIGMDPLGIDEDGELYCPAVTETPQFAPGVLAHPENGNDAGLLPLTFMMRPTVSSCAPGRDGLYAMDDSVLTWWQPAENDPEPTLTVDLGGGVFSVSAMRILWRDIGMDCEAGIDPGPFRYVVEYISHRKQEDWQILVDASENTEDLCIDYRQFEPATVYAIRLRILGAHKGITPGLTSLTVFGRCGEI